MKKNGKIKASFSTKKGHQKALKKNKSYAKKGGEERFLRWWPLKKGII